MINVVFKCNLAITTNQLLKMIKRFTMTALAFSLCLSAFAQDAPDAAVVEKIRKAGLNNSKVMDIAFNLTDVSGPRLSNSPGLKRAQEWAVKQLTEWGLKNAHLEAWGTFGKGWQVDKYYAATTAPFYHPIIASPKAWTPGTNGPIKSEVILIKADSVADLAKYKGKLAGKIVMMDQGAPLTSGLKPDFTRYADTTLAQMAAAKPMAAGARQRPTGGPMADRMAQMMKMREVRAAMSAMLVEEKVALILTYARGGQGTFFTSNGASYALDAKPVSPELEVAAEDFLHILRLLRAGKPVEVEADIKTSFYDQDPQGYNVIAEIPGTDKN